MKQWINNKFNIDKIIIVILVILMVIPYSIKFFEIRITFIVTILVGLIFLYFMVINREEIKKKLDNKFIKLNILFVIVIICSLLLNMSKIKFNDIYEPMKYVVLSCITIIIMIICQKKENYIYILKVINITTIIITIFGIIQYFNPFSINEMYLKLYTTEPHYRTLINNYPYPRVIGTKWTPPAWALLMSLAVYFNILNLKYNKCKMKSIIAIILCIINLMMTLTRTNQLAFMVSIILFVLLNVLERKGWKKAIISVVIAILLTLTFLIVLPDKLTWRLMQITDLSNVNSWNIRINKWGGQLALLKGNALFGIGPIKNIVDKIEYADSELIQTILQYGIIGSIVYLLMLFIPIYCYIKDRKLHNILLFYPSILVMILIHNISASSLILFDTSIGIYIMIGLLFIDNKIEKVKEDTN